MDTRTLCLGVLNRGDASGYEIKKSFEEGPLAHIHEASFGSIYPALTRLAEERLVEFEAQPQDKRPDKKLYSITASGRAELERALERDPGPDHVRSDFLFILFFAHLLPIVTLRHLVDGRIALYKSILARMDACEDLDQRPLGERFVHEFGLVVYRRAYDFLVDNRNRLLQEAEESASQNGRIAAAE